MKVYYVEFIISDGTIEEQRLQPIVASSEAKALEYAKEVLENPKADYTKHLLSMRPQFGQHYTTQSAGESK